MTPRNTPIIQIENLSKIYRTGRHEVRALYNLSLEVQPGEIFGYLGPNGAGKTTTIRLLLDIIRPTSGSARVLGMDVHADSVPLHRHIGFLPGELNLWKNLTGLQVVQYIGQVRGGVDMAYVYTLTERLQLDLSLRIRSYSSGNRRKLGLVLALMNKPQLLILDEPTNGLDPLMQHIFNELMLETRGEGRTVFLSSHVLSEVQAICDRVAILRSGELQAVETVYDLTHNDFQWITLRLRDRMDLNTIAAVPGVSDLSQSADGRVIDLRLSGDFDPLLRALSSHYVEDIDTREPALEEIFLAFYGSNRVVKNTGTREGVRS
ncbi:MAG: ABC transporter ATP-binding protein [Anaerolineae bacterium]|nr:ABC transporter ATP-binding protein [Anaerolineae bacterium]